jgi:hypothetical protein
LFRFPEPALTELARGTRIVWLNGNADIHRSLAGEGIIVGENFDWDGLGVNPGLPVLRLGRDAERATLARLGTAETSMPIGALQLGDLNALPTVETLADAGFDLAREDRVMVFAAASARPAWASALLSRSRSGPPAILACLDEGHELIVEIFEKGEARTLQLTHRALLGTIRHCAAVILTVQSAADRLLTTNIGIAALGFESVLFAMDDPVYSRWILAKCVHRGKSADISTLLQQAKAGIADQSKGRPTARGRRWFDHLYQWASMQDRVELGLTILLDTKEAQI